MAVSFILNELFSLPWVPSEAHIYIEERTQHLPAHEKRKMHRRAALAAAESEAASPSSPAVSFPNPPNSAPAASKEGKANKPKK